MVPPTVLVLDGDLGFLLALAQELSNRQILAVPARTSRQALSFLARFRLEPDLIVLNCRIPGACSVAGEIAGKRPHVHILALMSDGNECAECSGLITSRLHDPEDKAPDRIPSFVDLIQRIMNPQARALFRVC